MIGRGFTLIELLVVIALIGMLTTVILGSLRTATLNASDAAIKRQVLEFRTILEFEYSDNGTYTNLKPGLWKPTAQACSVGYAGRYQTKAVEICESIARYGGSACSAVGAGGCLFTGTTINPPAGKYAIMAYLPGASTKAGEAMYFCLGSSGAQSITPSSGGWNVPGCQLNP